MRAIHRYDLGQGRETIVQGIAMFFSYEAPKLFVFASCSASLPVIH